MPITAKQFNLLATKNDLNEFKQEIRENVVSKQEFQTTMDTVVKKLDTIEHAFVSNMAAHDRFEQRITKIEDYLGFGQLTSKKQPVKSKK
jgi:septal ring factor EnvC (AmiA/AmiB activator)